MFMSKLLFIITNCWSGSYSKAKLYCFYDIKSVKEKFLEPGFIESITFAGSLRLRKEPEGTPITDIESAESYNIPYEQFDKLEWKNKSNSDYPHDMFSFGKFEDRDPFFCYKILSWGLTNGEITSNMNQHKPNSFHRALYEFFYKLKNNRVYDYAEYSKDNAISKWLAVLNEVESRPESEIELNTSQEHLF